MADSKNRGRAPCPITGEDGDASTRERPGQQLIERENQTARLSASHHETSDSYTGVVARLCPRYRVIVCKDAIQWILQRRDAQRSGQPRWKGVGYFQTREALMRVSRTLCERIDPNAWAILVTLPGTIGGS